MLLLEKHGKEKAKKIVIYVIVYKAKIDDGQHSSIGLLQYRILE